MPLGSGSGRLKGDEVSERFEFGDAALGVAFAVAALVEVAAEVVGGLAGW
jgi:hypothetical protein